MTGPKDTNQTIAAAPDDLLKVGKDAEIELSEAQLNNVTGGVQKVVDKTDSHFGTGDVPWVADKTDRLHR